MTLTADIPLRKLPRPEWDDEFNRLLTDNELRRTYDRERRLRLAIKRLGLVDPELTDRPLGLVLEIGTDTGEFLECCRHFGFAPTGFAAGNGEAAVTGFGKLSALLHERQGLRVLSGGLQAFEDFHAHGEVELVHIPSLEAVLPEHLTENHEDSIRRSRWWKIGPALDRALIRLLCVSHQQLRVGGRLVIGLEGTLNHAPFENRLDATIFRVGGFELVSKAHGVRRLRRLG